MVVVVPLVYVTEVVSVAYTVKLLAFQAALFCLYAVWMLKPNGPTFLRTSPFTLPVALYLAATLLSIFQAVNRVEAVVQLSHQVALTFLFLVLLNQVRSRDLHRYLKPIAAVGALLGLIGILQYLGLDLLLQIPSSGMPSATLGYRNYAAMVMLLTLPIGLLLFLEARRRNSVRIWGGAVALMLTFLIYTRTRGAWIGLGGACLIAGVTVLVLKWKASLPEAKDEAWWNNRAWAVIAAALAVVILSFLPPRMGKIGFEQQRPEKLGITQTMASVLTAEGDKSRLGLWKHTWKMIEDHPLFGVGAGNWQFVYPLYDKGEIITPTALPRRPHNDYLWITSELGLPGILIFLWILGLALLRSFRLAAGAKTPGEFWTPICLGLAVLAIMGDALFSFPRERITPSILFWSTLAFIAVLDADRRPALSGLNAWKTACTGGGILLVLCLWMAVRAFAFDRHYARAIAYANQNRWDRTIEETTTALHLGVFDSQVLLLRGLAHATVGNYSAAVEDNRRCLVYRPGFVNALNNLGIAYNGLKEYDKALDALHRLLQLDPDHVEVHANLGMAYKGLQRFDEAIAEFELALVRQPLNSEVRYRLATVYEQQDDPERAAEIYARILGDDFQHAGAHYRLGVINQNREFYDKAIHELQQTLLVDPAYLPAHFSLGEVYALQGDTARAIESYSAFLKAWQGSPKAAQRVKDRLETLSKEKLKIKN